MVDNRFVWEWEDMVLDLHSVKGRKMPKIPEEAGGEDESAPSEPSRNLQKAVDEPPKT